MTNNISFIRGWLSGFFDGDGSVGFYDRGDRPSTTKYLVATNTDKSIIKFAEKCLKKLDIGFNIYKCKKRKRKWKPAYMLYIARGDSIKKFGKLVGFRSKRKAKNLDELVEWINRPRNYRNGSVPTKEQLEELYLGDKLSMREIGRRLGYKVDKGGGTSVKYWLLKYKIPIYPFLKKT